VPVLDRQIGRDTPMGATLVEGGATVRTWAPAALDVYVVTAGQATSGWSEWSPEPSERFVALGDGTWAGFVPDVRDGDPYLFWVRGPGSEGFKRDPYARELAAEPAFPNCPCLIRDARSYPWHDSGWRPPPFHEMIIYQLHVGVFWAVDADGNDRRRGYGRFLDVIGRIPYLRDLGATAIQLLPIQEYDGAFSLGYNGLDYFSPEMTYQLEDPGEIARHLELINAMLAEAGRPAMAVADLLPGPNQLKCLIDLCHLNRLAVIFDVVYNHAGGGFGDRSLWFYDRQPHGDDNRSLYFTEHGHAGGKIFAYWQAPVRQFLIDNARFCVDEYHVDGLRYDQVSVASDHGGDGLWRDLTGTLRHLRPEALQIAEYWNWDRARAVTRPPDGLGFDAALADGLRDALRAALAQASGGGSTHVALDRVRDALYPPPAFPAAWRAVQCLENHDIVRFDHESQRPRAPRVPALADPSNARSWYARSRARVATTLLLTAPGIPMLFMGQEFLEDKPWHDDVVNWSRFLIWWDGLASDRAMRDFLRFTQDLLWLRRAHPALCGEGIRVPQVHEGDRILVVHRWVEGEGRDVVVVASFNEGTHFDYPIELPWPGWWREIFNSDYYDHFPNDQVAGNGRGVHAAGPGGPTYGFSARMTIPANGAIILAREP
jgi:1,4-alpha-glucan branching enzyme